MIDAKKSALFTKIFHYYNERLLKKSFYRIYLKQKSSLPDGPVVFIANHSSWWDGLLAFYLTRTVIHQDCYAMMTEKGLKSYPFFRKIGGYSINRDNPKDVIKSLAYTSSLLELQKGVWLFPQGKEEHLEKRPLLFQPGISHVVERTSCVTVVPVSFYYTFRHNQRPEVFVSIGEGIKKEHLSSLLSKKAITAFLEDVVTTQLDEQRTEVIEGILEDYQILLQSKLSFSEGAGK